MKVGDLVEWKLCISGKIHRHESDKLSHGLIIDYNYYAIYCLTDKGVLRWWDKKFWQVIKCK